MVTGFLLLFCSHPIRCKITKLSFERAYSWDGMDCTHRKYFPTWSLLVLNQATPGTKAYE